MRRTQLLCLGLVLLAGCQPDPSSVTGTPGDPEAQLASLRAAALAYQAAATAKDGAAVASMYDETALMVPPDADFVEGLDGVTDYRFGFIVTPGVELEFELVRAEVAQSGDIGWTVAVGQITIPRDEGPPGRDVVRDVHTWKRQADGTWKVVLDVWNSGALPTEG